MASIFPAFLTGAAGVQLADDLRFGEASLGRAIGLYFAAAALGSIVLGRVAERLGGTVGIRTGLGVTTAVMVAIAIGAEGPGSLTLLLVVAGFANALNQPSANLMLVERLHAGRLGLAMAIKQSGMPLASLLGGASVPTIALTVGWRWTYVAGAVVAIIAAVAAPNGRGGASRSVGTGRDAGSGRRPDLSMPILMTYGAVGLFAAAAAGSLAGFLVVGAEAAGVSPGGAGLLLTGGSAVGISSRLFHGWLADRGRLRPIRRVSALQLLGTIGFFTLAAHQPSTYLLGPVLAFGCGWSWPGLFNLSVVRNNPSAPAAATGVSQTGVFIGSALGPLVGGVIIERAGYGWFWSTAGTSLLLAGLLAAWLSHVLRGRSTAT